ncbi:MAG TPA: ATP-binding cassette domain-containing protein, partial [Chitinophaga sp.]
MSELIIDNVVAAYGQSTILWGVNMNLQPGLVTTVMGRNGVGKTTLLKTIMGLLPVKEGHIRFRGEDISRLPPFKKARAGIAYVPQGREIIPKLTVYENLQLGLEASAQRRAQLPEDEIYSLFPILREFRKRPGGQLSGGQ